MSECVVCCPCQVRMARKKKDVRETERNKRMGYTG